MESLSHHPTCSNLYGGLTPIGYNRLPVFSVFTNVLLESVALIWFVCFLVCLFVCLFFVFQYRKWRASLVIFVDVDVDILSSTPHGAFQGWFTTLFGGLCQTASGAVYNVWIMSCECPLIWMRYEVDTRGSHCQGFVTSLVVLLRPTEQIMWSVVSETGPTVYRPYPRNF